MEYSNEYLVSVKSICNMLFDKSNKTNDKKLLYISMMIFNYLKGILSELKLEYSKIETEDCINLFPLYEYKTVNKIELYNLQEIQPDDVDIQNKLNIERFVLSHIFYMFRN